MGHNLLLWRMGRDAVMAAELQDDARSLLAAAFDDDPRSARGCCIAGRDVMLQWLLHSR